MINLKFWTWPDRHREKVAQKRMQLSDEWVTVLTTSITEGLRHTQVAGNFSHHITYAQKPIPPRPEQITLIWTFGDGHQYRQFFPLHGQSWIESIPMNVTWGNFDNPAERPVSLEMAITYRDSGGPVR